MFGGQKYCRSAVHHRRSIHKGLIARLPMPVADLGQNWPRSSMWFCLTWPHVGVGSFVATVTYKSTSPILSDRSSG
jgi:hypothetical protein